MSVIELEPGIQRILVRRVEISQGVEEPLLGEQHLPAGHLLQHAHRTVEQRGQVRIELNALPAHAAARARVPRSKSSSVMP